MPFYLRIKGQTHKLNPPLIMGVLNITPDSFSDGGKWIDNKKAVARAQEIITEGADIIDIGGESTGPGSKDVSAEEESKRIIPVIEKIVALKKNRIFHDFLISVDTYKPEVAQAALAAGADMINDVTALRFGGEKMARVITAFQCPIVLMYSKDPTARTSRKNIRYHNVIATIGKFLRERIKFAQKYGIKKSQIIIDPGMGAFISGIGSYSFEILRRLAEFKKLGLPILVGTSRKGFLGEALASARREPWLPAGRRAARASPEASLGIKELSPDRKALKKFSPENNPLPLQQRLEASIVSSLIALQNGADIVRVHDVKEMKRAMEIWRQVKNSYRS